MCPQSLLRYNKLQCVRLSSVLIHSCRHVPLCMAVDVCLLSRRALSHSWSCQDSEVMLAWHVVIDWTGLGLYAAAVTKAHSGQDNGELTAWVVFITLLLSLSPSLPPVYCVCCLTVCLARSQSLKAPAHAHPAACLLL